MKKIKIILSGGGTGGHIYPAVATAEALRRKLGDGVELLFVGANGKMEMEKIPALGYEIEGLPVAGLQRRLDWRNLLLPFKVLKSLHLARKIVKNFKADVVAGFGGYASAPVLKAAQRRGIPTVVQEQNSYAGLTNKLLAKGARKICVAYEGMERFFPAERIVMTGNPLRASFNHESKKEALDYFGFAADKPVILVVGGSLGSRTFNDMMKRWAGHIATETEVQVIWQTGKIYEKEIDEFLTGKKFEKIRRNAFIERMDYAYAAADLVISRSGAITVSELCLMGKAVMFVPSPNVSEDHQTKNAMALVAKNAAEICPDHEAIERAIPTALELVYDKSRLAELSKNITKLGVPDSADRVAEEILKSI